MKQAGQLVLTPFPYTDLSGAKLRPVLMLRQSPRFDDWLVCMVSSRIEQAEAGFDEVLRPDDPDFATSGLRPAYCVFLASRCLMVRYWWAASAPSPTSGWPASASGSRSGSSSARINPRITAVPPAPSFDRKLA